MKRLPIYIMMSLAGLCLAGAVSASAQTLEKKDSVVLYQWGDAKTYSEATGSFKSINSEDLERRAMGDLRARLQGMTPGLWVTESGGSFLSSSTSSLTSFGIGTGGYDMNLKGKSIIYCLVDDIPVPFNQVLLDPNQIESITIIDDILDKVNAGPMAGTGAISIKTKTGAYNKPLKVNVDFEGGMNFNGIVPEWCTGAEYAELNNYARNASGLQPLYSDEAIAAFGNRNAYDLQYPCVDYKSLMMKNMFDTERIGLQMSAGSNNIRYNVSTNVLRSGDINNGDQSDYYKINLSASFMTKIGRYIEAGADFHGLISYRHLSNYNPLNFFSVPECAFPLVLDTIQASEDAEFSEIGRNIYGVSNTFVNNYYAQMKEGGFYEYRNRSGFFRANLNVDWSFLLKGLTSKTMVQESSFIYTKIGKSNQYIAHFWTPEDGMGERSTTHTGVVATSRSRAAYSITQSLNFAHVFNYDYEKNGHKVHASANFSLTDYSQTGNDNRQRLISSIVGARYSYKGRYVAELASEWAGSPRYMKGSRWGWFPSVGLAWNVNNEEFLKDVEWINTLKVRAQVGESPLSNNVFGTQYLYQANYGSASGDVFGPVSYSGEKWFGVNTRTSKKTTVSRMAAEDLTWERVAQKDFGLEADLFGCLRLSGNYYILESKGLIADVNSILPEVYGLDGITLYKNYEASSIRGWAAGIQYHQRFGDFFLTAGGNLEQYKTSYDTLVSDEYIYEYQKKTGYPTTVIRGYECIGKYESQEQIDALPSYIDKASLNIGDLIYRDKNEDGKIDANDKCIIGNNNPKLRAAVNIGLTWRNFDVQVIGQGYFGMDYDLTDNGYFTRGSGDENLSKFVLDKLGTEYPSLSYHQSTNNFISSSFWIRDRSYFKIKSAELGYTFDFQKNNAKAAVKGLRLSLHGENLATFSKFEYCDPEAPSSGISVYPLFRVVTLGAKIQF